MLQEVKVGYERGLGKRKRTHKDFAVGYLWVVFRRTVFGSYQNRPGRTVIWEKG